VEELVLFAWAMFVQEGEDGKGVCMAVWPSWFEWKEAIVESGKAFKGGIYKELTGRPEPKG